MLLTQTAPPAEQPITLDDFKAHAIIEGTDDDAYLEICIKAATRMTETITKRALITQSWEMSLDCWWVGDLRIPRPPLQTVSSIKYMDADGMQQTLDPGVYQVGGVGDRGRIRLVSGEAWPTLQTGRIEAVVIAFTCGYADDAAAFVGDPLDPQNEDIAQAVRILADHLEKNRELATFEQLSTVPSSVDVLLDMHTIVGGA